MEDAETMMQRRQPYVLCGFLIRLQRVSLAVKRRSAATVKPPKSQTSIFWSMRSRHNY